MNTSTIKRHQAGTVIAGEKTGGQFAAHERRQATAPGTSDSIPANEDFKRVRGIVDSIVARKSTFGDREDIVQDAVLELYQWADRKDLNSLSRDHIPIIKRITRFHLSKYANGHEHHTSHAGRVLLAEKTAELEQQLGRNLSGAEKEALAEKVRVEEFPPSRRPAIGYHRGVQRTTSLDAILDEDPENDEMNSQRGVIAVTDPRLDADTDEDPKNARAYGAALDRLEEGVENKVDARNQVWSVLREADPTVPPITYIDSATATRLRAIVRRDEDALMDAVQRYESGRYTVQDEELLFTAFGGADSLDIEQQDAVVDRIKSEPKRAYGLWNAALSAARKQPESATGEVGEF